ncbi:MAG: hypothetical protein HYS18_16855 [Burkholderiales bacterium]|nr:hypothetical protein [Burkholderiales bacterium]
MDSRPISAELVIFFIIIANIAGIVLYSAFSKWKMRSHEKNIARINATILDHFQKSGVTVSVSCVSLQNDGKRYTAFVESEPMKRFRLSHIIEMMLRQQVAKTCGLKLEKIYWRFPIKDTDQDARAQGPDTVMEKPESGERDEYINEGLVNYKDLPKADVSEISWEKFAEVSADSTLDGIDHNKNKQS